ncbi:MAG: glycoside hydrolase family 15 protein [Spirochaetales bacterium]|nr:glycoside hydrolase family 15 protein [Spirochaetales bacterium]
MQAHDVVQQSLSLILNSQNERGAFPSSPSYEPYRYCWFRDGSFIAYAALISGSSESCKSFLEWGDRTICAQRPLIENLIERQGRGECISQTELLPSRYYSDGTPHIDESPGTQIDGFGNWLWCLGEYALRTGDHRGITAMEESVQLLRRYIEAFWKEPGADCWEEHPEGIHPSTLASVAGGLKTVNNILGEKDIQDLVSQILHFVRKAASKNGWIPKTLGTSEVDASSLMFSGFFDLFSPEELVIRTTAHEVEQQLREGGTGGVRRFLGDEYYGGGEWIFTSALLALHALKEGKIEKAIELRQWIENQFDSQGFLPEQIQGPQINWEKQRHWFKKWGTPMSPNLRSHAMHLILVHEEAQYVSRLA